MPELLPQLRKDHHGDGKRAQGYRHGFLVLSHRPVQRWHIQRIGLDQESIVLFLNGALEEDADQRRDQRQ